jgi:hypothetical protein
LGLALTGSPLEPILKEFEAELQRTGIRRLRPRFYLSTEWGVPFGTVAIAIPFYLARSDLTALHAKRAGYGPEGVAIAIPFYLARSDLTALHAKRAGYGPEGDADHF